MWKWALAITAGLVVVVITAFEIARRSGEEETSPVGAAPESTEVEQVGAPGYDPSDPSTDQEFDQAGDITDSRKNDIERAKGKVKVFTDAVKEN